MESDTGSFRSSAGNLPRTRLAEPPRGRKTQVIP